MKMSNNPERGTNGGMKMKRFFVAVLVLVLAIAFAGVAFAAKPETPKDIEGATVVGDAWVKANYKKMQVFDVRKKAEYVEAHIPGAVSIPYKEKSGKKADFDSTKDKIKLDKFPSNKSTPLIVYCNGPKCWKSYKTAVTLVRAGYKYVYQYRNNGFPGWKSKGYPVE